MKKLAGELLALERQGIAWGAEDLIGGHPCLDFVNTAGGGAKRRDVERLVRYEVLADWSRLAGLITPREAKPLLRLAKASPDLAEQALHEAQAFREDLHGVLTALSHGRDAPERSWRRVTSWMTQCLAASGLRGGPSGFLRSVDVKDGGLDTILLRIGLFANDLLLDEDLRLLKACDRCSWLYLDRSKGRRRRWCSMRTCGNRAKVQRFAERQRN